MAALGSGRNPKPSELGPGIAEDQCGICVYQQGHTCGIKAVFYVSYRVEMVMGG